ncbi:hypothetical protein SAMN02745157_1463 [Kaistia soli DSM 19436]|uniref:Uncharacterized protein n=1 Tax=Kaistia soli DSM 19436 TaxID=1122133 RepID=A0A1M4Y9X2_9HYPH|nr:hypothetical protein [Kaistia soli]SHF02448.1 hypothetical protein SAMN02745157_1463 [Kaistia soli DSM 19436]
MTPETALAMYRRQIDKHGEPVALRRVNRRPDPDADLPIRARVLSQAKPDDLVNAVSQSNRVIVMLAADIEASDWPGPPLKGDKVILRGRALTITAVDDDKRRIAGVLIAYEITAGG